MISKTEKLKKALMRKWTSNFEASNLVFSAHADRMIREIRANEIPAGYEMKEKWCKFKPSNIEKTIYYKKYKLVKK